MPDSDDLTAAIEAGETLLAAVRALASDATLGLEAPHRFTIEECVAEVEFLLGVLRKVAARAERCTR